MTPGERIREMREEQGLSIYELSRRLGVTDRCIHSWETGRTLPGFESIRAICNYFDISADEFMELRCRS